MKKVYTLLTIAAVSALTVAAAPAPVKSAVLPVSKAKSDKVIVDSRENIAAPAAAPSRTKVVPAGEYKSLGMGKMTDDMVLTQFTDRVPATYEVEIRQSVENPNFYQVIAPYGTNFAVEAVKQVNGLEDTNYDSTNSKILTLDATDPDKVTFEEFATGCDWGWGEMFIGLLDDKYLTFKDGVFSAPEQGLYIRDNDGSYYANRNGKFRILLPGVKEPDYSISLQMETQCLDNRNVVGSVTVGDDVVTVKYKIYPNVAIEKRLEDRLDEVVTGGTILDKDSYESFSCTMGDNYKETLIVVSLDAAGTLRDYTLTSYYYLPDDSDQWEDCGNVRFVTDLLGKALNEQSAETLTVPFQRNKADSSRLRLVNPFANSVYSLNNVHNSAHNHYITINVRDRDFIYFEESPIGFETQVQGYIRICTTAGLYLIDGYTKEELKELNITLPTFDETNNAIVFPSRSLGYSAMKDKKYAWYSSNSENNTITFPKDFDVFGGVNDITIDDSDASARWYNLQGVEVTDPVAGNIYIRVSGGKADKVIFHAGSPR